MRRILALLVLLCCADVSSAAIVTEQFTGTDGNAVSGWTLTPNIATWSTAEFKYRVGSIARIEGMVATNQDQGASLDSLSPGNVEILVKFRPNNWLSTGNMVGPFFGFSWQTGIITSADCGFGVTVSITDTAVEIHNWPGMNPDALEQSDECFPRVPNIGAKSSDFAVTGTWYIARLRIVEPVAQLKVWRPDTESEPGSWDVAANIGSGHSGITGVMMDPTNDLSATLDVDWFVVATAGETATNPDAPVASRRVVVVQ